MGSEGPALVIIMRSAAVSPQVIKLKPGDYLVGRDPGCDVVVADPYVSRTHARIFYKDGKWYIVDLGSKNGTYVNGEDIKGREAVELREGAEIVIGFSALIVKGFE